MTTNSVSLGARAANWLWDRSLTLVMLALFLLFLVGQILTGWFEFNQTQAQHGAATATLTAYLAVGHMWEALFENWESEFLQMAAFVTLTSFLYQKGSPESRRPGVTELVGRPESLRGSGRRSLAGQTRGMGARGVRTLAGPRAVSVLRALVGWSPGRRLG